MRNTAAPPDSFGAACRNFLSNPVFSRRRPRTCPRAKLAHPAWEALTNEVPPNPGIHNRSADTCRTDDRLWNGRPQGFWRLKNGSPAGRLGIAATPIGGGLMPLAEARTSGGIFRDWLPNAGARRGGRARRLAARSTRRCPDARVEPARGTSAAVPRSPSADEPIDAG